jgi:heme a synthase
MLALENLPKADYGGRMNEARQRDGLQGVRIWLGVMLGLILLMVAVGGITRLTDSGLSMTTWEPVMGAIPPLSADDWQFRFDQYRSSPEYQQLRKGMSLEEFKFIFFWEYFHRLLGRLLGLVYAVPLAFFWWRGLLQRGLKIKLLVGLFLGGLQGLMGWYMVKSGLVDDPYVSHFRLAAHLGLAFIVFSYLLAILLSLLRLEQPRGRASRSALGWGTAIAALLVLQMLWGAFVAGLNAGFMYNTYPLMQGYWIAPHWNYMQPFIMNLIDNPITVQFIHRWLGAILLLVTFAGWVALRRDPSVHGLRRWSIDMTALAMAGQFVLGILTLVLHVPLALGVMHQVLACALTGLVTVLLYSLLHKEGEAV